jgi:hypothetical protein
VGISPRTPLAGGVREGGVPPRERRLGSQQRLLPSSAAATAVRLSPHRGTVPTQHHRLLLQGYSCTVSDLEKYVPLARPGRRPAATVAAALPS